MNGFAEKTSPMLHAFRVVAEELHFGHAASRLNIAQPPLSQRIRRLESLAGCKLLERNTRNVRLTEAGRALLTAAERVMRELNVAVDQARRIDRGEVGLLTVGFTPTTALQVLPAILSVHRARFPEVELQLIELLPDPMSEMLHSGGIDVGLGREMLPAEEIAAIPLFDEPYVAVLPATHAHALGEGPIELASLRDDPFILFPPDRTSRNNIVAMQMCVLSGFRPRVVQEAPGWQTAVSLVGSGLGVTILPACTRSLALPGVRYRLFKPAQASTIALLRRSQDSRPLLLHFIESARETIRRQLPE